MVFTLPPKSEVGYLDPEIAGEGVKVIHSDGEQVNWTPPPVRPVMPDWSQIKSIQKYFNRSGYQTWPSWLYHPTEAPRIVKNAEEAGELGVCYREATDDERAKYGKKTVWDWADDSKWRPTPYERDLKFDPTKLGQGKTYIPTAPNPRVAQHELVEALIPQVAAAVAQALKATGPSAPAHIDPKQWDAFLQFQAFQKTAETVDALKEESDASLASAHTNALSAVYSEDDDADERSLWIDEAKRLNVKIDGRWSLERIKEAVEKAA